MCCPVRARASAICASLASGVASRKTVWSIVACLAIRDCLLVDARPRRPWAAGIPDRDQDAPANGQCRVNIPSPSRPKAGCRETRTCTSRSRASPNLAVVRRMAFAHRRARLEGKQSSNIPSAPATAASPLADGRTRCHPPRARRPIAGQAAWPADERIEPPIAEIRDHSSQHYTHRPCRHATGPSNLRGKRNNPVVWFAGDLSLV